MLGRVPHIERATKAEREGCGQFHCYISNKGKRKLSFSSGLQVDIKKNHCFPSLLFFLEHDGGTVKSLPWVC